MDIFHGHLNNLSLLPSHHFRKDGFRWSFVRFRQMIMAIIYVKVATCMAQGRQRLIYLVSYSLKCCISEQINHDAVLGLVITLTLPLTAIELLVYISFLTLCLQFQLHQNAKDQTAPRNKILNLKTILPLLLP